MDSSPPPLAHHSWSFPVIAIALIGILATALLLVGYYVFVIKCCINFNRIDFLGRFSSRRRRNLFHNLPTVGADVTTKGLPDAIIRSIPVIKFRKLPEHERENNNGEKSETASSYECAVCLSEFEDRERLRVIPNCCHAFHIDCIDIWLQNNANCPLCRSGISPSSILRINDRIFSESSALESPSGGDNFAGNDEDYVVIEIEGNNLDEPRLVRSNTQVEDWIEMKRGKDEEFAIDQPIRRSFSMDLSANRELCLEIEQCSKVRRSIFSPFGYGRNNSVQPIDLDK